MRTRRLRATGSLAIGGSASTACDSRVRHGQRNHPIGLAIRAAAKFRNGSPGTSEFSI
jgi:hypothetical protein